MIVSSRRSLAAGYPKDSSSTLNIACIIPSFNGGRLLERLLSSLKKQVASFDVLVVDSGSSDGSADVARAAGACVVEIPSHEFNHGGTRQMMVDLFPSYDVYVFVTQDAYLEDEDAVTNLVCSFADREVGAACGRQLAHHDATLLAEHARVFNYPEKNDTRSLADVPRLGIKAAFISNSFAAYRREALASVGGFPSHLILAEDMYVAAKMLTLGWRIAYVGSACCRHSHNYSLLEESRRYFDTGVFHAREAWLRREFGGAASEGLKFIRSELRFLGLRRPHLWPVAFLRNVCKLLAYKLGQRESWLPLSFKRRASMHFRYWFAD